jgi:hypothetical protein
MADAAAPTDIDPDRLQHNPEYRSRVIAEIAEKFRALAEEKDFDTTFSELAEENPELVAEVSDHVEAKIESLVEQKITKERLSRGMIRRSIRPRRTKKAASGGGSGLGSKVGEVVDVLPTRST